MPISRSAPLPALLWVFLCFMTPARAATLNVPTTAYPTIQAGINATANGDTVLVADGTYSGPGNRDIDFNGKNITVASQHGAASTIIDCGGSSNANHRGFNLHSGETGAVINGFTVQNGFTSTSSFTSPGSGGAVFLGGGTSVTLSNCTFSGNSVSVSGTGTGTGTGGGVYNAGAVTLTNCTISGDTISGSGLGGGVFNAVGGTATLTNCTLSGDSASTGGGVDNSGAATLTGCTVSSDTDSVFGGGGIYNDGTATLMGCTLSGNSDSGSGGGGVHNAGTATLTNCTLSSNTARSGGGGVYNDNSATATLTGCTLSGNSAIRLGGNGGGVYSTGTVTLTNCTLSSNTASSGGGVYNTSSNGPISVTNCVFTANSANSGSGGGVYNSSVGTGPISVTNCTLTANSASNGGGIYNTNRNNNTITLTNDIVYGDTGGEIVNNTGAPSSVTFSDVQQTTGVFPGIGNINADPLFVNAPTDLHLRPGSPCLGAGTSNGAPTTDKDGNARPAPPSIGAYEATPSHTHLLWNNTDGRVMLWSIAQDGTFTLNGFGPYTDGAPQNKWSATAVATGADGVSHLLWNNTDGRVMLWTVDDQGNFTYTGYGPYTDDAPQNLWHAVAVSVGPDNVVHLLWSNTDRRAMLWNVAPDFSFTLAGYGPYTDNAPQNIWTATALATGPDNKSHILWTNTDTRVMLWNVTPDFSFTLAGYGPYTDGAPQNQWIGLDLSVGPDNVQHILWGNTDRRAMFWDVDSAFGFTLAGYGPYTDNGANNLWSATALATSPDGLSHLLWNNTDYRAMLWGVDSAFNFTVAGYGPYTDNYVNNSPGNLWSATAVSAGP